MSNLLARDDEAQSVPWSKIGPDIQPKVLCNARAPCLIVLYSPEVDPLLIRHASAPREKRHSIWPHRIAELPTPALNDLPDMLPHHGWRHRVLK